MPEAMSVEARQQVRDFISDYYEAWRQSDEDRILAFFPEEVEIQVPMGVLTGKTAVRDLFVRPLIAGFPGNVHAIGKLAFAPGLVAVEWEFQAEHTGAFAGIPATGRRVRTPGCSFYEYDLAERVIPSGRIYFDLGTLLRQIGA
jgi:steroid delta-isomerase-like uncharacterized protein